MKASDYFGSLKMCVRLPDTNPGHRVRFVCMSCSWRYENGQRHTLYEVPAGNYPVIRFSREPSPPARFPERCPAAVVVPFVLEPFKRHLFHEIAAEVDHWISAELVSFRQWNREEKEVVEIDGPGGGSP